MRCPLARSLAHSHASFLRPHRGVVTRESQFITAFRDRCMSCGLLPGAKYSHRATGVVDRPANRSFCGIIFSIPTTSTVVAYNISRHINIPEGRRAAPRRPMHSAGERTTRAPVQPPRPRSGVHLGSISATGGESERKRGPLNK